MSSILNFFLVAEFSCAVLDFYSWTAPRVSCMLCEIRFNLIFFFLDLCYCLVAVELLEKQVFGSYGSD